MNIFMKATSLEETPQQKPLPLSGGIRGETLRCNAHFYEGNPLPLIRGHKMGNASIRRGRFPCPIGSGARARMPVISEEVEPPLTKYLYIH